MVVVGLFIGYLFGKSILGGLYWTFFTSGIGPNSPRGNRIEAIWSVIGAILGAMIMS